MSTEYLGNVVKRELIRKLKERYEKDGVIILGDLPRAQSDVEFCIADFERSPTGPSTRNATVLALVRRTIINEIQPLLHLIRTAHSEGIDLSFNEIEKD